MSEINRLTVSVIIPTFNRASVIERAIDSVHRQSYPHVEIVVVDDGSVDDTVARLERRQRSGLRILVNHGNFGPARARNLGIAASSGDFVAFLDSDDTWEPWKLEAQMACFERGATDLGAVYCGRRIKLADGETIDIEPGIRGRIFAELRRRNFIPLPTLLLRRDALQAVGAFDPSLPACEDWDLVLRLAKRYSFDVVSRPAVHYAGSGADRMSARARAVFIANHRILRRYSRHAPNRDVLAAHMALQSRELLALGRSGLAARYALRSLWLNFDRDEKLAVQTLKQLVQRRPLGRFLVQAYRWRHVLP